MAQIVRKEKQLHLESEPSTSQTLLPSSASSISSEPMSTKAITNVGLMDFLSQRISQVTNTSNATVDSIVTTRQYLELPTLALNENTISYWIKYPTKELRKIAERYICEVPGTSVPSERIFSKAGQIISAKRSNLKPTTVNAIIFLNQNAWLIEE